MSAKAAMIAGLVLVLALPLAAAAESLDPRDDPTVGLTGPEHPQQRRSLPARERMPRAAPPERVEEPSEGYYIDMERRYLHIQ